MPKRITPVKGEPYLFLNPTSIGWLLQTTKQQERDAYKYMNSLPPGDPVRPKVYRDIKLIQKLLDTLTTHHYHMTQHQKKGFGHTGPRSVYVDLEE